MKNILVFVLFLSSISITKGQQFQDCKSAFPICEKQTYNFQFMGGYGDQHEEFGSTCFNLTSTKETNAKWLKFKIDNPGTLTFVISPNNENDDIDFILYKSNQKCDDLEEVRCMASGEALGNNQANYNCKGETGLDISSQDAFEKVGCKYNDDNFLKFLFAKKSEEYYLLVNNYDSESGFSISFDGDSDLQPSSECLTNIKEEKIQISNLYPIPSKEEINLEYYSKMSNNCELTILDMKGELIKEIMKPTKIGTNKHTINISSLPAGNYLLRIRNDTYSSVKKFVKL